ncbi:hypothetical protein T06_3317 [Trichinella sp. T6]|nr:hypothetical protein T06_3317 [Trichinella sp. T6]
MAISSLLYSFEMEYFFSISPSNSLILTIVTCFAVHRESKKGFFSALYLFGNLYLETVLQGAIEIDSFHFWEAFRSQLDPTTGDSVERQHYRATSGTFSTLLNQRLLTR